MASVKWNQDLNAGENWWTDLNLKNTAGANRNITNHTLASQIKRHYKSVAAKETIAITVVNYGTGNIQMRLTDKQTSNLKNGKWIYDVELTDRSGSVVAFSGGGGSGATAVSTVGTDGTITAVTVTAGGTGYVAQDVERVIDGTISIRPEITT